MKENIYTKEEMIQMITELNREEKIIAEFKEVEGVNIITEEDITNIFCSTYFDEHIYWYPRYMYGNRVYTYLTDYEQYEIDNGYDPILGENIDELDRQENEPWIEYFDSLHILEDNYPCKEIDVDDFIFELASELKKRLAQAKAEINQSSERNYSVTIQKYENWISILNHLDGFITPQELVFLEKCISGYDSECGPYERRKEIRRNMWFVNSWFDINLLEFESKIYKIDLKDLFELTEILLEFESQFYCTTCSNSNLDSNSGKHEWPISTFYYCWEIFDFDRIHWYEIQAEISLAESGLIQDIWSSDHVIFIMDEDNATNTEYDYYINQFSYSDHHNLDMIDIRDLESLTEDDMFKDTWLVAGMEFPSHMDYFWEAEITNLCQTQAGDFYTDLHDDLSESEFENYSKYLCYQGDSGFYYCNMEDCDRCSFTPKEKIPNKKYLLWEKFVQPLELD